MRSSFLGFDFFVSRGEIVVTQSATGRIVFQAATAARPSSIVGHGDRAFMLGGHRFWDEHGVLFVKHSDTGVKESLGAVDESRREFHNYFA